MSFALDANVLVHASDADSPVHGRARAFIDQCAAGTALVCLAWPVVTAYLRIVTHPAVFRRPLAPAEAMANIAALLALPQLRLLSEQDGFWKVYREVSLAQPPRGSQVPDTHLAALLWQHGITTLYTRDRDFRRFDFLTVIDPLADELHDRPRRRPLSSRAGTAPPPRPRPRAARR